ncbi:hypothetical protein [Megamonas funiformis]|uniref:hypothetical protein n=1 Tax=Megamonas funiformis TaxID=437897 RepID=UPI003F7EDF82
MISADLIIDKMLVIDDSGMPIAPTIRQLMDKDIKQLYTRDKTKDKSNYIKECIVIYYLGDPKSPAKQSGLSDAESLKMAIQQAGLKNDYIPDELVQKIIKRYYYQNITEAGKVVENIQKGIHNINLSIDAINGILNEKLQSGLTLDDLSNILGMIDNVNKKASELPSIIKRLEEAKQNLMYEKETEVARGGNAVLSSMDASNY